MFSALWVYCKHQQCPIQRLLVNIQTFNLPGWCWHIHPRTHQIAAYASKTSERTKACFYLMKWDCGTIIVHCLSHVIICAQFIMQTFFEKRLSWGQFSKKERVSKGVGVGKWVLSWQLKFVVSSHQTKKKLPIKEKWDLLSYSYLVSTLEPKSAFMLLFSTK